MICLLVFEHNIMLGLQEIIIIIIDEKKINKASNQILGTLIYLGKPLMEKNQPIMNSLLTLT
jgi:hypothetical protein